MKLSPVKAHNTSYPSRSLRRAEWLRRALGVAVTAAALGLGACGGHGPLRDDIDEQEEEWENVPGARPAPVFSCSEEAPEWMPTLAAPGVHEGELCGERTGWAALEIQEEGLYRLTISSGVDLVFLALLDPEGDQFAQVDVDMPSVTARLTPGRWSLASSAADPVTNGWGFFELTIERL